MTPRDVRDALAGVPAEARRLADRRAEIERQHAMLANVRVTAKRVSVDGRAFGMDEPGIALSVRGGPTPRGSSVFYVMSIVPIAEEDVEDFHGGWAT